MEMSIKRNPAAASAAVGSRTSLRERVGNFFESSSGHYLIASLVVLNAVIVGMESYASLNASVGPALRLLDTVLLYAFAFEIGLRMFAAGSLRKFAGNGWNMFDVVIVGAAFMPGVGSFIAAARVLRMLRLLSLLSTFPDLRRIASTMVKSIPGVAHVAMLFGLLLYSYAVVGTFSFRDTAPEMFGTLHRSCITMFQVATIEGWNDVRDAVLTAHPWSWAFFVTFILFGSYMVMNMFVGIIVGNMQDARDEESEADPEDEAVFRKQVLSELKALRQQVKG